ncbi:hypothetical protein SprV_0401404900 [Sparganum proliferum]
MQLRFSGHLVRMDDERLPQRLFYGDVASSPSTDRPTWRRTVKTGQPHRRHQSQTRSTQITTAPSPQRRRTTAFNVSSVSTDIPGTKWAYWTPSDQLRLSDRANRRPSTRLFPVVSANSDCPSEPPVPSPSSSSSTVRTTAALAAVTHINTPHIPDTTTDTTPQPPTPEVRTKTTPALTATATSPHTSAWSVTCESIAQRLANQCLDSTSHAVLAHLRIAWT